MQELTWKRFLTSSSTYLVNIFLYTVLKQNLSSEGEQQKETVPAHP